MEIKKKRFCTGPANVGATRPELAISSQLVISQSAHDPQDQTKDQKAGKQPSQ